MHLFMRMFLEFNRWYRSQTSLGMELKCHHADHKKLLRIYRKQFRFNSVEAVARRCSVKKCS